MRLTNINSISLRQLEQDLPEDLDKFNNNISIIKNKNINRLTGRDDI